jgi:hypothetical protein
MSNKKQLASALLFGILSASLAAQQTTPALQHRSQSQAPTFTAQLPTGTGLHLALDQEMSSAYSKIGDKFTAHLVEPVISAGLTLLPKDTVITGRVADVTNSGRRFRGKNTLTLRPESVTLADGTKLDINAIMTDSDEHKALKVDDEGAVSNSAGHYARMAEIGSGVGTVAGAIVGGPVGAVAGASLGAALPTARWATRDQPVELTKGTTFWFELTRPVSLQASAAQPNQPTTVTPSKPLPEPSAASSSKPSPEPAKAKSDTDPAAPSSDDQ